MSKLYQDEPAPSYLGLSSGMNHLENRDYYANNNEYEDTTNHAMTRSIEEITLPSSSPTTLTTTATTPTTPIKNTTKKSKWFLFSFPLPVQLIFFNELTERFAYYGNRAILTLFLKSIDFDTTKAVLVFSLQSALSCTMPLIGGHIADAWMGRYWTIVLFSCLYLVGALLLAFAADTRFIDSKQDPIYVYIALLLTALGTGGIKPCVSTFGAEQIISIESKQLDQEPIQQQQQQQSPQQLQPTQSNAEEDKEPLSSESFFLGFYFMMNVGSILATLFIPIVRTHVSYFWAFLLPAAFMLISIIILLIGRAFDMFKLTPPDGGILGKVGRVLWRSCCRHSYTNRVFVIPVPISVPTDSNGGDGDSVRQQEDDLLFTPDSLFTAGTINQPEHGFGHKVRTLNMLVSVHDFVRFVHLNYDYVINRLYNPTFDLDANTVETNNPLNQFNYESPSWLVPQLTCSFDPRNNSSQGAQYQSTYDYGVGNNDSADNILATESLFSPKPIAPLPSTKNLTIRYGACQCSAECTCGCGCNEAPGFNRKTDETILQSAINSQNPASSNHYIRETTQQQSLPSPCQCSGPVSEHEIVAESRFVLHHFKNADQFLQPGNNIRQDSSPPSPGAFDAIHSTNLTYIPYYPDQQDFSLPLQPRKERTLCCLPKYTSLSQFFSGMDVSSDEYNVLDWVNAKSPWCGPATKPISLDDLRLPLFYTTNPLQPVTNYVSDDHTIGSERSFDGDDNLVTERLAKSETTKASILTVSGQFIQALRIVLVIIPVLLTLPVFWSLMNQQGSTWMVQAEEMDLNVYIFGLDKKGWRIEPEQLSILNPIFLFIFLPILDFITRAMKPSASEDDGEAGMRRTDDGLDEDAGGYVNQVDKEDIPASQLNNSTFGPDDPTIQRSLTTLSTPMITEDKLQQSVPRQTNDSNTISPTSFSSPLTKMIIGMSFAAISYLCAAGVDRFISNAAKRIDPVTLLPEKVSVLWQIPQYFWITMAEVCISVTGLYFVFDMSPANMKSLVTALYLFSGAMGDFLTGLFYTIFEKWGFSRLQMFIAFAVSIMINSLLIVVIQRVYGKLYQFK